MGEYVDAVLNKKPNEFKELVLKGIQERVKIAIDAKREKVGKSLSESTVSEDDISNYIRDSLSGTPRKTTAKLMFNLAKKSLPKVKFPQFSKVWDELVDEGYLLKTGDSYVWEM